METTSAQTRACETERASAIARSFRLLARPSTSTCPATRARSNAQRRKRADRIRPTRRSDAQTR
eukprot:2184177-Lingulodinium_polyedra.AAC.1